MLGATSSFQIASRPGAGAQVARIGLEGGEQVEIRSGADEAAATALHALLVERVGDERHRDASPHQRGGDGQQGIEISVRAETGDDDVHRVARRTVHAAGLFTPDSDRG